MALLSLRDIQVRFGGPALLDGVTLQVERGERICLLGRNGEGKSTLLAVASGRLIPDAGEVARSRDVRVTLMPQEVPTQMAGSVLETVMEGARAEEDVWRREQRARKVISQMELEAETACATLSGGMKRRVLLARALAGDPDVLLLDEPTNHLDVASIEWMENFLGRFPGAILFVTHDRELLRRLATRIVELDRGRLRSWACRYGQYLERKAAALAEEERHNAAFDKKLAQEEAWVRKGIRARRTRNEGRVRELERLRRERAARRNTLGSPEAVLQEAGRSGWKVAVAKNLGRAYGGNWVFRHLDLTLCRGDKIGLLGPNGCGKSTLIRTLLGEDAPEEGSVEHGTHLETAYFDQLRETLDEDKSVFENLADGNDFVMINGQRRHVTGYLEEFLFPPERTRCPVRALSGGERSRLLLARLFARPSNVLVLDEPTNDLDVETLELLEDLLVEYGGTVLLVSHDRQFLNEVVTGTLAFEGDGQVREYPGGYDDWLAQRPAAAVTAAKVETGGASAPESGKESTGGEGVGRPRKLSNRERKEFQELPERISAAERALAELHERMAGAGFYKSPPEEIQAATSLAATEAERIEGMYARWAELEALQL